MPENFADRLLEATDRKGSPICVGIDPQYDKLPAALRTAADGDAPGQLARIGEFCWGVLDAVAPLAAAVKPQSAYFEAYGAAGAAAYEQVVGWARQLGLIVIGDVKRGDIGSTAAAYAAGHLARGGAADAVTVNPYLGADGIVPFVKAAAATGRGAFVLVRTSNPSGAYVQDFSDAAGKELYRHVAELVALIGSEATLVGQRGYSCVGAVVGATYPAEARLLREVMPRQIFLVPGYGAQGAGAGDCAAAFRADGTGAIVNASRSVIFAHQRAEYAGMDWKSAVAAAARAFADDIRSALPGA